MKVAVAADAHFSQFVETGTDSLLTTAYLLTHDRVSAEELVQDTLAALYPQWQRVADADSSIAYVRRALLNRFVNQRRKKSSTEIVTDDLPERPTGSDFSARIADRDQLRRALTRLPDRQRAAVVLRYFHDLSDDDAADALDCRVGTVRSLISRALETMRSNPAIAGLDDDDADDQKGAVR